MATLIDISNEVQDLEIALSQAETEEEQQLLIVKFLQSKHDLLTKLDSYAALIAELEARAEFRKAEAKRLAERAAVNANLAKRLKERLLWYLHSQGLKKVETHRYNISTAAVGGKLPLIVDEEYSPTQLPERFQKVSVEADTKAIREALEAGEELPYARFGIRQQVVRIK